MKKAFIVLVLSIFFVIQGCSPQAESKNTTELTVSAASSMTEALLELKEVFEREHPSIHISYNFGGSGALRKQIEQGAPIDLFFSASKRDYKKLIDQSAIEKGTAIFTNKLVLIKSEQAQLQSLDDVMQQDGNIAIGTPEAVPAGTYAEEAFINLGVWDKLQEQDRIVYTKDVSQVGTLVSQGAVDAGIVYSSDVIARDDVEIIEKIDSNLHSSIEYFAAIIKNGEQHEDVIQAREIFYQYILEDTAKEIIHQHGFQLME